MTPHHISLGYFLQNWREAVNIVKTAQRLQQGGLLSLYRQTNPVNESRTEVAAPLFSDMANCYPVSPLCLHPAETVGDHCAWFSTG